MEFMVCMLHYCSSRELSPSHTPCTRAAINVVVQLSNSLFFFLCIFFLFFAACSRASTHALSPGRAIQPVTLLSAARRLMRRPTLLVGWPWKMVVNIESAGHWGRGTACGTSELGSTDSCECMVTPDCISSAKRSVQIDSQSAIGTEPQLRALKALTSYSGPDSRLHRIGFATGQGSVHTSFPLSHVEHKHCYEIYVALFT